MLAGLIVLSVSIPYLGADVLDDLGVTERQFARGFHMPVFNRTGTSSHSLIGLEISEEHAKNVEAELLRLRGAALIRFYEDCGEFAKALEVEDTNPLARIRLLYRAGRLKEARAALNGDDLGRWAESSALERVLLEACRPLEDAEAWDDLQGFLHLLSERSHPPQWKVAIWTEELDVAYHRNRLQAILDEAKEDPLRLAVFHHRLGNKDERDKLAAGLLKGAPPARVAEILGFLPNCPPVISHVKILFGGETLTQQERVDLFSQIVLLPLGNAEDLLQDWLAKGGDAMPLADLIWLRWSKNQVTWPSGFAILTMLLQRYPDDPRFQWLMARQVMESDPSRAAELFEKVAAQPIIESKHTHPSQWYSYDLRSIPEETRDDLAYWAIVGLGLLNRQDLVQAVLTRQGGLTKLPVVDQVRYLDAGGMDYELMKVIVAADFRKPANDVLPGWLKVFLNPRKNSRVLPKTFVIEIGAKFDELVAGSPQKEVRTIVEDAVGLMEELGNDDLETTVWKASLGRLLGSLESRNSTLADSLDQRLRSAAARLPRLKEIMPDEVRTPTPSNRSEDYTRGVESFRLLTLFALPEINRIRPAEPMSRRGSSDFSVLHGSLNPPLPLDFLDRWSDHFSPHGMVLPGVGRPMRKETQEVLKKLMRRFVAGDPRRLPAEILIARDLLDCGDDALKAEARASVEAMMSGEKSIPGTEAFRCISLTYSQSSESQLRKALSEVKKLPLSAREDLVMRYMYGRMPNSAMLDRLKLELGIKDPQQSRTERPPDEDGLKLNVLERENRSASPEGVELAKRLLDKTMAGSGDSSDFPHVHSASRVLQITGQLDAWIDDSRRKLIESGMSKVDVLRRLQRIDPRKSASGDPLAYGYARDILALDPTDSRAAGLLLSEAARVGDGKLLLSCLRAMESNGLYQLSRKEILAALGKEQAAEVFAIARLRNRQGSTSEAQALGNLHGYFLSANPSVAAEFRDWMDSLGGIPQASRNQIAGQLLDAGRKDEAVEMFARAFVTPPEYPGFPYRFPPKPGSGLGKVHGDFNVSNMELDLAFLRGRNLFAEVIARIEELGKGEPLAIATFRMAETPDPGTFETKVLPVLKEMEIHDRSLTIIRWIDLFAKQPRTGPLLLCLIEERANGQEDGRYDKIYQAINHAADLPGGSQLIASQWTRLRKAMDGIEDPDQKDNLTRIMCSVLEEMLHSADDPTWNDYWKWREKIALPLGGSDRFPFGLPPTGFIDPIRLGRMIPRVLVDAEGKLPDERAGGWALAAAATGDPVLLEKVKAAISKESRLSVELCDLALGGPHAVSPVMDVILEGNGKALLTWNLVGVPPINEGNEINDIPRCPFPALDGKFEIQVTAGTAPDRQVTVRKISAAPASGHVNIDLTADQRFVAMLVTEPATGVVRWTRPLEVKFQGGTAVPISDEDWVKHGFEKLPWGGPGGLPAWKIRFSGQERIDLLDHPWNGAEPVALEGWVSGDGKLQLRCLDAGGRELSALNLTTWDSPLPVWQHCRVQAPQNAMIPAETVRLVLSASVNGPSDGPIDFAISNARMAIGPTAALYDNTERVTRIPGAAVSVSLSPDARNLAVGMASGMIVTMNLETLEVREISPSIATDRRDDFGPSVRWNEAGLYALQADGFLYKLDEETWRLTQLTQLLRRDSPPAISKFKVSGDGNWIAWVDGPRGLILSSGDFKIRREISSSALLGFEFTDKGMVLEFRDGRRSFLKTADFRSGEPVAMEDTADTLQETHPLWKDRLRYKRESVPPGADFVHLPVEPSCSAISGDGTLYYVGESGILMRMKP